MSDPRSPHNYLFNILVADAEMFINRSKNIRNTDTERESASGLPNLESRLG